ncbi:alpha/beta hydrolase family protein [Cognatilysobacter tabacisoli]|uniref:alpha/beta hydrolase family protein n=1 Tax=Cognatilysobacter tabacisoli TaxID=2315424 RepID=UPI000E6B26EA|nr:S9 family peptidase [Lysobacter tabacisoli]
MKHILMALAFGVAVSAPIAHAADVDVEAFVKRDRFDDIKLSPNGDYYAATVPLGDRTALAVLRRSDNKLTATFQIGKNTHVAGFWWVNPERVLISTARKFGSLDQPLLTGDIYAINADGTRPDVLVGQSVVSAGPGTKIQPKKAELVAAFLVDDLPRDDRNVVIAVSPFSADPFTRAEQMDVYTGRRTQLARAPVRNARFTVDHDGVVRFARGVGSDNVNKLYYRAGENAPWELINDEAATSRREWVLGLSADDSLAYLEVEQPRGPNAVVAMDIATRERKQVLRDDNVDVHSVILRNGTLVPVGVTFMDGKPRTDFFDAQSPEARLYRSLEAAFGGPVQVTSQTSDGRYALVYLRSDVNPGDYYIFDNVAKKADHLVSRREWFDPAAMAPMRPVSFVARDGLPIHGYLSTPEGSQGKSMPMVVLPHGGPFGIQDNWGFDTDVQLLARAGYAVLQVNYRGSSGYGRAFQQAGAKQWGGTMQDDLTDATKWAIKEGIADPSRICLYGGSYGGYASLMGVAKEPSLYRCAVGYVGVYDLPTMQRADARESKRFANWSSEWVGSGDLLVANSPTRLADRIKVPVFLAAGGEDEIAPIAHSRMMEQALRKANVPVETLYYDTEGHGFYKDEHRREYYTRLLAFLSRHLGGGVAKAGGTVPTTAGK